MNLDKFKSQISNQGLARSSNWICSVFPPKSLSSVANSIDIPVGRFGNLNLPGIDLNNISLAIANIKNADSNLPDVSIDANIKLPVFGFTAVNNGTFIDRINLYCSQVNIPEREIKNYEWREHGESRQLGIVHNHSKGVTVSYYCSEDLRERYFFEQWQDIIFNSRNKKRGYYNDYVSRIEISKYDRGWNEKQATYLLHEAYPTNISSQSLEHDGNTLLRLNINFKYRYYERIE